MKRKLTLKMMLAAVGLLVGLNSAWAGESVSFTAIERITKNVDNSWTAGSNAGNKYALAIADLSGVSGISDAGIVTVEFDTQINSGGRWYIGVGDKAVRGTTAGSSNKTTYDTNGLITRFGTGNGSTYTINGSGDYSAFGVRVRVTLTLNRTTGQYSCVLHDTTNDTDIYNVSGVSTSVDNATIVEAYSWNNNDNTLSYLSDVTVTVTAAYSYTVNAVATISGSPTVLKTMTGKVMPDVKATVPYPKYINYKGTLYTTNATSSQYRYDFTPAANNETKQITYTATDITNVIFFTEGEDIEGATLQNNGGCYSRTSDCATGVASNTAFVTLPAGTYKITMGFYNANSGNHTATITDGANTIFTNAFAQGWSSYTSPENIVLDGTKTLYATGGDTRANYPKGIDYIYITGNFADGADATCWIENPDMETSAGGSEYWQEGVKGWNNCSVVTNYRHLTFTAEQNPNGAFTGTNAFENWTGEAGGLVGQMSQTIQGIPNGVYKFQLAVLAQNIGAQFVYAKSNGKTYSTPLAGAGSVAKDYEVIAVVEDNQLEIGLDMNGADNPWAAIDNARLTYAPSVSKTITTAGWATYCSPYALDLSSATGLTDAYIVTGGKNGVLTKTSVKGGTVPANTGLLLKGTEGSEVNVTIPVVASSETNVTANILDGVTAATEIAAEAGWVLMASPSLGFYQNTNAFTVGANTAYIPVADLAVPDAGARAFYSLFDSETTGVGAALVKNGIVNNEIFNLQGQRIGQPTKGLYIVNGRKVIVK